MDPDCAICFQPSSVPCNCEVNGLNIALKQAEQRMMTAKYEDIRSWVRGHAQDYILSYFSVLSKRRKDLHANRIHQLHEHASRFHTYPHPRDLAIADAELKHGTNEDWRASVQRYPEVLEYFFGLVDVSYPSEEDSAVMDPPLSALGGARPKAVGGGRDREHERNRDTRYMDHGRRSVPPHAAYGRRPMSAFAPGPGIYRHH